MGKHNFNEKELNNFFKKISKVPNKKGCLEWTGGLFVSGYGLWCLNNKHHSKKQYYAHRLNYELKMNVELAPDECVCHKCDNPLCCNIDHVFVGTRKDNVYDMIAKRRHVYGERVVTAKLTKEQVKEIRKFKKDFDQGLIKQKEVAEMYGVSQAMIHYIFYKKSWKIIK